MSNENNNDEWLDVDRLAEALKPKYNHNPLL
jgi:hypothetical protein